MPATLIHLLTSQNFTHASVQCGAHASHASVDPARVTCPACLGRQCSCGPATTPCPVCRAWNRQHGARQTTPPTGITAEKALQEAVRRLALDTGWMYYHVRDSRKSPAGYPDVTLVRGDRLLFAELKRPGKRPTEAQQQWLDALARVTQVSTFLWTPDEWGAIEEALR
jgi:hypothetical protein